MKNTIIYHDLQKELGITLIQYCVLDIIHQLGKTKSNKWCTVSKKNIGNFIGVSREHVIRTINKLVILGVVERGQGSELRTTDLFVSRLFYYSI